MFGFNKKPLPSLPDFNQLFGKSNIEGLSIHVRRNVFTNKFYSFGLIKFKNGNTTGEQKFEADKFEEVFKQMQDFMNNLK